MTRPIAPGRRRVAITGLGVVSPLGTGVAKTWQAALAAHSGIRRITRFDAQGFASQIAGEIPDFAPDDFIDRKEQKRLDPFVQFALAAASMAVDDARFAPDAALAERTGCVIGVGFGGIGTTEECAKLYFEGGPRRISPFFVPRAIANLAAGTVSMHWGLRGANYSTTSACASGANAIGDAFRQIRDGYLDAAVAGGSEAAVTPLGIGGFAAMRALSTRNDEPTRASRPFDRDRDGFVLGEGAAIVVLEEFEAARARGAAIHAELVGYGINSDAHHITQPAPEGRGAARCMELALADAMTSPASVGYVNAHGTSTEFNDACETLAIKRVFGEHVARLPVSSTKSMTGHLLGAAGALEAVFTALALRDQVIPPTINLENPDPVCDLDYVPGEMRRAEFDVAISNSFGFGGTNVCLVLRRADR